MNILSFVASVVTIFCCTVFILWLNSYAQKGDKDDIVPSLEVWAVALAYTTYRMAVSCFYVSLFFAFLATVVGAMGFLSQTLATAVSLGLVLLGVIVMVLASVTLAIPSHSTGGLELDEELGQTTKSVDEVWVVKVSLECLSRKDNMPYDGKYAKCL